MRLTARRAAIWKVFMLCIFTLVAICKGLMLFIPVCVAIGMGFTCFVSGLWVRELFFCDPRLDKLKIAPPKQKPREFVHDPCNGQNIA